MSDTRENAQPPRFWALILLLPALASFLGMLARDYLAIRWLALVSGDTMNGWGAMVAPMVMSILIAMLMLAVQMAVVARIYSIGIFPIATTWRSPNFGKPLIQSASSVALVAVATGLALALWVEPFVFAGKVSRVGFTSFIVATALLAGLVIVPMIMRGERRRTDRQAHS